MDSANETQLQLQELVSSFSLDNNDQIRSDLDDLERSFLLVDDRTTTDKGLDDLVAGFEVSPQKESTEESMDNLFKTFFIDEEEQNAINHEIDLLVESFYIKDGTQQALDDLVSSFEVKKNPNEKWQGFPWLPGTENTTEFTPKTLDFQELAEKLKGKELVFTEVIVSNVSSLKSEYVQPIYERLNEALEARRDGKNDYYAEARVVRLFRDIKAVSGTKYGQLMENLERETGVTENLINSFSEDTMITDEHEKNLHTYLTKTKTGKVLEMYEGFLEELEKTRVGGKLDLKQISPLGLYLLNLASANMANETKGIENQAKFTETILKDPEDRARANLAAETIKNLPEEIREKVLALYGKMQRKEELTDEEKELKKKYANILEVKEIEEIDPSLVMPVGGQVEAKNYEEALIKISPELGQKISRIIQLSNDDKTDSFLIDKEFIETIDQIVELMKSGKITDREVRFLVGSQIKIWDALFGRLYANPEVLDEKVVLPDGKGYGRSIKAILISKAFGQNLSPEEQVFLKEHEKELKFEKAPAVAATVEAKSNIQKDIKDLDLDETITATNFVSGKITDEKTYEENKDIFIRLLIHFDELVKKQKFSKEDFHKAQGKIIMPVVFDVQAMLFEKFGQDRRKIEADLEREENSQTVEQLKKSGPKRRIEFSRRTAIALLSVGLSALGLSLLFGGRGQQVEAVKTTPIGQPPAGQIAPVDGATTQGDVVGGVAFNSPREQAGYPNPNESTLPSQNPTPAPQTNQEGETTPSTDMNKKVVMKITIGNKEGENVFPTWGHFNRYLAKTLGVDMPVGYQWGDQFGEVYDAESVAVTGKKSNIPGRQEAELEKTKWNDSFEITQDIVDIMKANLQKAGFLK